MSLGTLKTTLSLWSTRGYKRTIFIAAVLQIKTRHFALLYFRDKKWGAQRRQSSGVKFWRYYLTRRHRASPRKTVTEKNPVIKNFEWRFCWDDVRWIKVSSAVSNLLDNITIGDVGGRAANIVGTVPLLGRLLTASEARRRKALV